MKDPTRWREAGSEASAELRALLHSDRSVVPPEGAKQQIWSSLAAELGNLPPPPASPGPVAAGTSALAAKLTVVVLAAAAGTGVGWYGLSARGDAGGRTAGTTTRPAVTALPAIPSLPSQQATDPGTHTAPVAQRLATRAPIATDPAVPRTGSRGRGPVAAADYGDGIVKREPARQQASPAKASRPAASAPPSSPTEPSPPGREDPAPGALQPPAAALPSSWGPSPWATPSPATSGKAAASGSLARAASRAATNELLEESRRLASARAALRIGDPDRALELLGTGGGIATLGQERAALTIEALAAKPATRADAIARARAFLQTYPRSPYRARIKAVISPSP